MIELFERLDYTLTRLKENIVVQKHTKKDYFWMKLDDYKKPNDFPAESDINWEKRESGDMWGEPREFHCWFRQVVEVPASFVGKNVYLEVSTGKHGWDINNPQFIAYIDRELVQGLDVNHTCIEIDSNIDKFELLLYAYSGIFIDDKMDLDISLKLIDKNTEKLFYDMQVPFEVLKYLENDTKNYADILMNLNSAIDCLDFRLPHSDIYNESVASALDMMRGDFYGSYCKKQGIDTICVGHTHIDIGWLWRTKQTKEKVVRTFSTVVNLMKRYKEYKFMSSQAYLYNVIKNDEPKLYSAIKELIKEGRWEVEGAMWVEADCNLASGESLIRQILYGKQFFKQEFDVDCKVLWLPDVFGYSASLPQILQGSGIDKFVTAKISWSDTNQIPYDMFMWKGIDGSEVFTYFICTQGKVLGKKPTRYTCYVGYANPAEVAGTWERFQQKNLTNEVMHLFGYGDGGGGVTVEQLEYLQRMAHGIEGCPNTKIERAGEFLDRMVARVKGNKRLPKWVGELYLELHRGTYTSIARNKRYNRKSELLYQNVELTSVITSKLFGEQYKQKDIYNNWLDIMTNQFHDILPGSAIKEVYDDCEIEYKKIISDGEKIVGDNLSLICSNVSSDGGLLVFNPNSFCSDGVVCVNGKHYFAQQIPPKGYKVIAKEERKTKVMVTAKQIENKYFKMEFDGDYNVISLEDKLNGRQVIYGNEKFNLLRAYDEPKHDLYDAWETRKYYKEKFWDINDVISVTTFSEDVQAGLIITKKFVNSTIEQKVIFYDEIDRIDFETHIDWKESNIMVKAEFPVNINTDKATYDIQFGNVQRNIHANTSWDDARYEVCAHKFMDMSEGNYGVGLLNDCKYGHSAESHKMCLTLLKSATYPNKEADKEHHEFTYSVYPHSGNFAQSDVIKHSYQLNLPMQAIEIPKSKGDYPSEFSLIKCSCDNVLIETIKLAEQSDDYIIRLYEAKNFRVNVELEFGIDIVDANICDLMENNLQKLDIDKRRISFSMNPFEIKTIKVR